MVRLRTRYGAVPSSALSRELRADEREMTKILNDLVKNGLARARLVRGEYSYEVTRRGLDSLAISWLISKGFISDLGERLGVGKESEVYLAWAPNGVPLTVKLHREGLRQFKALRRLRGYALNIGDWIEVSILTASREFEALLTVKRSGGLVPRPVVAHLNAVVTEYVEGLELDQVTSLGLQDSKRVLSDVIETLRVAYANGIVHGDLSPYNILVSEGDRRGYLIDWSQYVNVDDSSAQSLLREGVEHIASFFRRRFGLSVNPEELVNRVKGG